MKRRLTYIFFSNFWYKLLALALASVCWYIVQGEEILEVQHQLIVHMRPPQGYLIKGGETRSKDVTLRGPRALLGRYASSAPTEVEIDILTKKTGIQRIRVDRSYLSDLSNRIGATIHDPYIDAFIDKKVTQIVAIKEVLLGTPADGYIVEKVDIKPTVVTVTGPRTDLIKLKEVPTEAIDITGIQQSKSFEAKIATSSLADKELSEETVTVSLQVGEKKVNKRFSSIPIDVVGSEYLSSTRPKYVSIVIQGTPGVLSFVKRGDLRAFVEATEMGPGRYDKAVQVKIPQDTVLIETVPDKASVEIYNQKRIN